MSLLNWFSRKNEKAAVLSAIDKLAKELPASVIIAGRGKASVNKVTRLLERTYGEIVSISGPRGFGFVGRALIANVFKWGLMDKGYPDEFVEMATEGLIVALSRNKS